ncbi:uncharacterized protein SCHCODRAFT_02513648 [Schizophyllum commune H4-8]|uniref:Uncharacterized protein n=1 Tax=Schizophyllum commune (strain H4-8 / FGSC 9210) TaxID=578458 RepID=D8QD58_SCHCM|nr:uncharacterized protein SCHCODRAFT_02513648 [Schizophyllum commune H4-8]KAI5888858.1 hypothetical protein SCHCODRAFT_02513648 [Schizophyllum commune H4-8]
MSRTSSTPSSLSALGYQPSCFPCALECTLATHSPTHHRGKTGRELSSGDIRTTTISLLAPFYEALKGYRSVKLDDKSLARTSTFCSQPSRSSSRRPSVASGSCASGKGGPKRRPCVIVEAGAATAKVILMGTFEGAYIDELHPILQEYLAILFSQDSTYEEERFTKGRPAHMHSTPEWAQKPKHLGHLQYIVPLRHEIDLHAATDRWEVLRRGDGGSPRSAGDGDTEGYYMDGENMSDLISHAEVMYDRLRGRCQRRSYRHALRQALRERGKARNPNRSQASVQTRHSRAPSVALEPIPETPTTPSYAMPAASTTPGRAENSWITPRKFSVSSTSSHTTASKRRSEYDEGCPRTPKAAKHELDASSTHSKKSKFSIPFMKSSKANTSQTSLPSLASQNQFAVLAC